MSDRKETPPYASPEPYKADRMAIHAAVRAEVTLLLSPTEIDILVTRKVLSLTIRKAYFNMLTNDTTVEQRRVFAIDCISMIIKDGLVTTK